MATAMLAAVVVRLGTMWFSVLCGLVAVLVLELQSKKMRPVTVKHSPLKNP
jgi:uncharacterized membrane protein YbhN (UPF0104 family)